MTGCLTRAIATTTPLTFVAGEGAELIDINGVRYLDFISGYGVTNTGHCHPHVVATIQAQAGRLMHVSTVGYNQVWLDYVERLCRHVPIANAKVFLTNSGTEAVEAALKLARYATGRPNFLAFGGAFHGRTIGSLSVTTSKSAFRARHEPFVPGVHVVPYPRHELQTTIDAIERLFREQSQPERFAAIIVEPILGEGGYVVPSDEFMPYLRELCDRHGIILIADEVQSGFGRSGKLFACEYTGVSPDLLTASKGIASGLPMGALIGKASLMDAWEPGAHGNTFGGNPVICAAAGATLDVMEGEGLLENASRRGDELRAGLGGIAAEYPEQIREVRGRGLMIGVEMDSSMSALRLRDALLARRCIVSTCGPDGNAIRLAPPLILTTDHVRTFLDAFHDAAHETLSSATLSSVSSH